MIIEIPQQFISSHKEYCITLQMPLVLYSLTRYVFYLMLSDTVSLVDRRFTLSDFG